MSADDVRVIRCENIDKAVEPSHARALVLVLLSVAWISPQMLHPRTRCAGLQVY
jgi:hypothetical protein